MKKIIKSIGMFALALCLLTTCILPVYAKNEKKLYFEEEDGKMVWNNVRGDDGNWFMSFTNMVPGGQYEDQIKIENGSLKTYALYMQVNSIKQENKLDDLLEKISMKVSLGGKVIYEGTASGKDYNQGDLQDVIYLGTYKPRQEDEIHVDLALDKNVGLEYCNLLTKNDWKFMVTEVKNSQKPEKKQTIHPPKTGDHTPVEVYIAIMACSVIVFIVIRRNKSSK